MSETKATRVAVSRSTVDGAVANTKFYIGGVDSERNVLRTLNTTELPTGVQEMLSAFAISSAFKAQYTQDKVTPEEALVVYDQFVASLRDGSWRPGRGPGETGPSILVLAIERWEKRAGPGTMQHTREEIEETLETLTAPQKRALSNSTELAPHIRDIQIERAREKARSAKGQVSIANLFAQAVPEDEEEDEEQLEEQAPEQAAQ